MEVSRKISNLDDESSVMLYKGCTISQMEQILSVDRRRLTQKIEENNIKPSGTLRGFPIYKLKDIIPYVVKPNYDVEAYLMKMNPQDLPKELSKEFWSGQRSKQEFLLRDGKLWPTETIVKDCGEFFKLVKMSILLMSDSIERQVELSEEQRAIIKRTMDGLLIELHSKITEKFRTKAPDGGTSDEDF